MKKALIAGITGQDGSYLARHLLSLGYEVIGTSRDADGGRGDNLRRLGVDKEVRLVSLNPVDFRSVLQTINSTAPNEIYNLSGQSSVGLSFTQPVETLESIGVATLNFLEAIRLYAPQIRFYNACSSECFGGLPHGRCDEQSRFQPRSPYAVAKSQSFWEINIYREAYGLYACSGIMFNHESPLRHPRFVTRKITTSAVRIANGSTERLRLGDLTVRRDWGWAPEYVVAMQLILQQSTPRDFVIATGAEASLEDFTAAAFRAAGLDWRNHVDIDPTLFRPNELQRCIGNPQLAADQLGWRAANRWNSVAELLITAETRALADGRP